MRSPFIANNVTSAWSRACRARLARAGRRARCGPSRGCGTRSRPWVGARWRQGCDPRCLRRGSTGRSWPAWTGAGRPSRRRCRHVPTTRKSAAPILRRARCPRDGAVHRTVGTELTCGAVLCIASCERGAPIADCSDLVIVPTCAESPAGRRNRRENVGKIRGRQGERVAVRGAGSGAGRVLDRWVVLGVGIEETRSASG